jgi:hypothetical protein
MIHVLPVNLLAPGILGEANLVFAAPLKAKSAAYGIQQDARFLRGEEVEIVVNVEVRRSKAVRDDFVTALGRTTVGRWGRSVVIGHEGNLSP